MTGVTIHDNPGLLQYMLEIKIHDSATCYYYTIYNSSAHDKLWQRDIRIYDSSYKFNYKMLQM